MLGDTILAQASAPGPGRAVVRISGPRARDVAALAFSPTPSVARAVQAGRVRLRGAEIDAFALTMVAPRSFTGEDTVELHFDAGPLAVSTLQEELLGSAADLGLRLAQPGEFTARACLNGRLDAARAEGILMLLHAADRRALQQGVQWLRGGLADAVLALRTELQDVLALLESGLDFTAGDTGEVDAAEVQPLLAAIEARAAELLRTVPSASTGGEVLLLGAANAGKSSLCNALSGSDEVLVDASAGTTRDVLRVELPDGAALWDAPGDLEDPATWDAASLALRDRLAGAAAAALVVIDATAPQVPRALAELSLPIVGVVYSKCDLVAAVPPLPFAVADGVDVIATSAIDGRGLDELRALLSARARRHHVDAGAPLRSAFEAIAVAVERARDLLATPELAAHELQAGLRSIEGIGGSHSPEALLDRIYGRFCLGK